MNLGSFMVTSVLRAQSKFFLEATLALAAPGLPHVDPLSQPHKS